MHSFVKYKNIDKFKELPLASFYIKLNKFKRNIFDLKGVSPRKREKKELKNKVLANVKKRYNELYYIYKEKYNKEINSLNTDDKKSFDYKNLRFSDYMYSSEEDEEQEEQQEQKQEKKDKKTSNTDEYIDWMINKEDGQVNQEILKKYFKIQKPSLMYKVLRRINDKEKNSNLVNMFNSALKYLEEDTKNMSK